MVAVIRTLMLCSRSDYRYLPELHNDVLHHNQITRICPCEVGKNNAILSVINVAVPSVRFFRVKVKKTIHCGMEYMFENGNDEYSKMRTLT